MPPKSPPDSDDADVLDPGLAQARAGQQAAEAAADDYYSTSSVSGARLNGLDVGVVQIVGELAGNFDVLRVAVGANALVALLLVFLAQGVRIEIQLQIGDKGRIFHFLSHLSFIVRARSSDFHPYRTLQSRHKFAAGIRQTMSVAPPHNLIRTNSLVVSNAWRSPAFTYG